MRVTVTTCGTSILTNKPEPGDVNFIRANANKRKEQYTPEEAAKINDIANARRTRLLNADEEATRQLSAELNGFISYYKRDGKLNDAVKDMHYLIHTDTYQGCKTAELIQEWGAARGIKFIPVKIDDLNTASVEEFRMGINNLIEWCGLALTGYRSQNYEVIFNLVGGFKSLQGYMQTLGMFYADETIYIFETGSELLSIPKMPVDFNAQAKQAVISNFEVFRKMQRGDISREECVAIPETLLDIMDGRCSLSAWGKVVWDECKKDAYSIKILPPASSRIIVSDNARKTCEELGPERIKMMNNVLDKLSLYVESNGKLNLQGCDFKKLEGNKVPPSTHEFDLWADIGGWRGFCHWEGDKLKIDSISMGLGHR